MSAHKEVNSTSTLGWVVLAVAIAVIAAVVIPIVVDYIHRYRIRRQDNRNFKVAEEIRNDFS